jgi:hypothetical protein
VFNTTGSLLISKCTGASLIGIATDERGNIYGAGTVYEEFDDGLFYPPATSNAYQETVAACCGFWLTVWDSTGTAK